MKIITALCFAFFLFTSPIYGEPSEQLPTLELCQEKDCSDLIEFPLFADNDFSNCSECDQSRDTFGRDAQAGSSTQSDNRLAREIGELAQVGLLSELIARSYSEKDKRMHARAGAYVGYFSKKACEHGPGLLQLDVKIGPTGQFFCALAGATLAGVLKEVYDSTDRKNHTVDPKDAVATAVGGFANIPLYRIEF